MTKILIIEDEIDVAESLKSLLEDEGHNVGIGLGGKQGLAKAKKDGYEVILLDILMPLMDGVEVLKRLKANAKTKNTPIILVTAVSSDSDVKAKIDSFAKGLLFISKPFSLSQILNAVKKSAK